MTILLSVMIIPIFMASFILQYFLSKNQNKWLGLIIPSIIFIMTTLFLVVSLAFSSYTRTDYAQYFTDYSIPGIMGQLLKIGIVYIPFIINLIIYFVCRKIFAKSKTNINAEKEMKKMLADDLD